MNPVSDKAEISVFVFVNKDEDAALNCLLRVWHRTPRRHRVHVFVPPACTMTRLLKWTNAHASRIAVHRMVPSGELLAQLAKKASAVFLEENAGPHPMWLSALVSGLNETCKKHPNAMTLATPGREPRDADPVRSRDLHPACVMLNEKAIDRLAEVGTPIESVRDVCAVLKGWFQRPRVFLVPASGVSLFNVPEPGAPIIPAIQGNIPRVLTVIHDARGGAVQTTLDLASALARDAQWQPVLLRCGPLAWRLEEFDSSGQTVEVASVEFARPWTMEAPMDAQREEALRHLLITVSPTVVHVRHLLGSGLRLLDIIHEKKLPLVVSHHDYYTVCPNIELLDDSGRCCFGECGRNHPDSLQTAADCEVSGIWELPRPEKRLRGDWLPVWRASMAESLLANAAIHITTSEAARRILCDNLPGLKPDSVKVIPHGRNFAESQSIATAPVSGKPAGVLSLGNLTHSKGGDVLLEIARHNRAAGSPLALHHLGPATREAELLAAGVKVYGKYERDQIPKIMANVELSFGILPQIWPETFSHTLTELWSLGLPVFASNIGAVGERVAREGGGWLFSPTQPEDWFSKMLEIVENTTAWQETAKRTCAATGDGVLEMARAYADVYRALLDTPGLRD